MFLMSAVIISILASVLLAAFSFLGRKNLLRKIVKTRLRRVTNPRLSILESFFISIVSTFFILLEFPQNLLRLFFRNKKGKNGRLYANFGDLIVIAYTLSCFHVLSSGVRDEWIAPLAIWRILFISAVGLDQLIGIGFPEESDSIRSFNRNVFMALLNTAQLIMLFTYLELHFKIINSPSLPEVLKTAEVFLTIGSRDLAGKPQDAALLFFFEKISVFLTLIVFFTNIVNLRYRDRTNS